MTQETKDKLKQAAAEKYPISGGLVANSIKRSAFKAGAQTILENPREWGLTYPHSQKLAEEVLSMQSQLTKYREALESIANAEDIGIKVDPLGIALLMKKRANEALKNNEG